MAFGETNFYPGFFDAYDMPVQSSGEMMQGLLDFPKNSLPKEQERINWEQLKRIKEAMQRLKESPDFQLYKKICHRRWVYRSYVNPVNGSSDADLREIFARYREQLVIMQINSDFNHYAELEIPEPDSK